MLTQYIPQWPGVPSCRIPRRGGRGAMSPSPGCWVSRDVTDRGAAEHSRTQAAFSSIITAALSLPSLSLSASPTLSQQHYYSSIICIIITIIIIFSISRTQAALSSITTQALSSPYLSLSVFPALRQHSAALFTYVSMIITIIITSPALLLSTWNSFHVGWFK